MTVDAREHAAVNGVLELVVVNKESDLFSVLFFGQSRVGVAGKAVTVLELVFSAKRRDQGKQSEGQRGRKNSSGRMHILGESNFETPRRDSGHKQPTSRSHFTQATL